MISDLERCQLQRADDAHFICFLPVVTCQGCSQACVLLPRGFVIRLGVRNPSGRGRIRLLDGYPHGYP